MSAQQFGGLPTNGGCGRKEPFPPLERLEPTNSAAFPTHAAGRQLPASSPIPGSSQLLDEGGSNRKERRDRPIRKLGGEAGPPADDWLLTQLVERCTMIEDELSY